MSRASWGKAVIALVLVMIMSFCIGIVLARTDFAYAAGTGLAEWLISTEKNKTLSTEGERLGVIVEADGNSADGTFNAIFKGDTTVTFGAPTTLLEDGSGVTRGKEIVYRIKDLSGQEIFSVHYVGNGWGTNVYVQYGTEIRGATNNGLGDAPLPEGAPAHGWISRIYYKEMIGDNFGLYAPYFSDNANRINLRNGKISFKWSGDVLNIYALNNNTDTEIRVASFDGTDTTFEIPDVRERAFTTMDEMNANGQFALPKIYDRLKDGYTISFESAGNVNVQIKAINDEELATMTAVPEYLTEYFAQQGIVYAYAVPQTALAGGNDLQLPAAVYLENGELKNAIVSATDPQGKTLTVQDGTVNVMNLGDYTVTYTAGTETYEHIVKAEKIGMPTSLAVSASDVSSAIEKTGDYAGLNVNLDGEKENFSGMLNGVFTGDTKVDFRFPLDADTVANSKVIFTVSDLNGNAVFDIVFDAGDGYETLPYIDYNGEIRAGVRNTLEAGWKSAVLFKQRSYPGAAHGTGFPNFASSNNTTVGYFSLEWAEDVLNIWYLASNRQPLKLAAFDGTDATLEIPENRIIVFNTESELNANAQFALPKIYDRLKDGYTISFKSSWHNEINFVSINGAALNQDVLTVQDVTYDVNIEGEENKEITVPQGSEVYADITYNLFFTNGWSVQQPNRVKVDVDTSATGARTAIVTDPAALQMLGVDVQETYTVNVREKTAEEIFADMAEKINMEAGAAIRLEEPAGLRFTTCVDKLAADTLASLYDEVAYGTMIVPEDMLAGKTLQELYGDESVLKVQSSGFYAEQNGSYIYRASIVNIRDYNYTRNFVGIGYVACADGVIFAQQYEATSRSVYSVAQKAFSDRVATADDVYCNEIDGLYSPYTAEQLSRIKELFIDAVVEIDTEGQYCGSTQYYEPAYLAEVQTDGDTGTRVVTVTSQTEIKTVYFGGEKVEQGRLSFSNGNKTVTFSAE